MNYTPFSKRNGYVSANDCIVRECLPEHVMNAIHNCFTDLFTEYNIWPSYYENIDADFGRNYLHCRTQNNQHKLFSPLKYVDCDELEWYEKIDIFEWTFTYLFQHLATEHIQSLRECIRDLNCQLELLNFAYRVVEGLFIEVTSASEITAINEALSVPDPNVKTHLQQAIRLISPSQSNPDYRNSIKEAILAVGSFLREKFGGNTLGNALKNMQKKYPNLLHRFIIQSIESLYTYTNQPNTGIRHELLSQDCVPDHSDATFMLVQASSIINYITNKLTIAK